MYYPIFEFKKQAMILDELIEDLQARFAEIKDHRSSINAKISLTNVLLSGFALFSLKDSSLLEYVTQYKARKGNLKTVYGISACPSDTAMRQILDEVAPEALQVLPVQYINLLLEERQLSRFKLQGANLDELMYIPLDGTQYFDSKKVHAGCCLTKKHKDGSITYHHNALVAVIAHPDLAQVLPVVCEEIRHQDGSCKNDHELCAATRLLPLVKQALGAQKAIIGGDSLFANAPFIRKTTILGFHYLLSIKEGYQGYPFVQFNKLALYKKTKVLQTKDQKYQYRYEFANDLILNGDNQDIKVNFVHFQQTNIKTLETTTFDFITDIPLSVENIIQIVKIGRTRWKIENETFNTLKNQGYQYEHNFGHGKKFLSQNFAQLMILAFLFDQIQQILDPLFKKSLTICKSKKLLWLRVRQIFDLVPCNSMDDIYKIIAAQIKLKIEMIV